jgi:hypothetical protein
MQIGSQNKTAVQLLGVGCSALLALFRKFWKSSVKALRGAEHLCRKVLTPFDQSEKISS